MKTSLIAQVKVIEQEADNIVSDAKHKAEQDALHVSKAMHNARTAITAKADKTSAQIISEHTKQANEEAHRIVKESNDVVAIIHATAEKNRSKTIAKAEQLFNAEYLS